MLIYDCEIKKAIRRSSEQAIEGIEYCDGWHDYDNMGISCIVAYDAIESRYRVFCDDNMADFQKLVDRHDIIVGFNSLGFDNKLCAANGITVTREKSYDLLAEVWVGAGLAPAYQGPSHAGYGLDALCEVNLGMKKSGHGAVAPVQWQRGEIGAVIDYCVMDVNLTKELLNHVLVRGTVKSPKDGKILTVRRPS
jgi:hypothetical protein